MTSCRRIFEGEKCPSPGCPGRFIRDSAWHPDGNGDFLRCDTCHLTDDEAEKMLANKSKERTL
jgi:hypothetical protein